MAVSSHSCNCCLRDITSSIKARKNTKEHCPHKSRGYMARDTPKTRYTEVRITCDKGNSMTRGSQRCYESHNGSFHRSQRYPNNAMDSAKMMEREYLTWQRMKAEKLQQFQKEVADRVRRIKKDQEHNDLNRSFQQDSQCENVIKKTVLPNSIAKPDNAPLYRQSIAHDKIQGSHQQSSNHFNNNPVAKDRLEIPRENELDFLADQSDKAHIVIQKARTDMLKRRANAEDEVHLPGGFWKTSPARDKTHSFEDTQEKVQEEVEAQQSLDTWTGTNTILPTGPCVSYRNVDTVPSDNRDQDVEGQNKYKDLEGGDSKMSLDFVFPGRASAREKLEAKTKYWNFRKHFMNLEREQVRETIRQRTHQQHICRLQQVKEEERYQTEKKLNTVANFIRPETDQEMIHDDRSLTENVRKGKHKDMEEGKKREMNRYIKALKAVIQEKAKYRNIYLPPMCSCGPSIWDAHPDTCANNCIFYKNPQAYARALSSVLATAEDS